MRCLSLADTLRPMANILFVCRFLLPALAELLRIGDYTVRRLPSYSGGTDADDLRHSHWLGASQTQDVLDTSEVILAAGGCDWLIIDHYGLDYRFEGPMRKYVGSIMVIDDLADRIHDCDVLVDQNLHANMESRYLGKVPGDCICLLGPRHCLLRDEFVQQRPRALPRAGPVRSILIYFGGVDSENRTQEALEVVLSLAASDIATGRLHVNVVVGAMHPAINLLRDMCRNRRAGFHIQTKVMARLMSTADLALGAGGTSTFERLYLRLPAFLTPIADNQREPLTFMESLGLLKLYETRQDLHELLRETLATENYSPPDCVENGIPTIMQLLWQRMICLKLHSPLDVRRTFHWLQDHTLRSDFQLTERPVRGQHFRYWRELLADKGQRVYAIYHKGCHVGNCGLKDIDSGIAVGELWIYLADINARGQGVATLVVKELQRIARDELNLQRLHLHVSRINLRATQLYRATGFVESLALLDPPWRNRDADIRRMECVL